MVVVNSPWSLHPAIDHGVGAAQFLSLIGVDLDEHLAEAQPSFDRGRRHGTTVESATCKNAQEKATQRGEGLADLPNQSKPTFSRLLGVSLPPRRVIRTSIHQAIGVLGSL